MFNLKTLKTELSFKRYLESVGSSLCLLPNISVVHFFFNIVFEIQNSPSALLIRKDKLTIVNRLS